MRIAAEALQPRIHEWAKQRPQTTSPSALIGQQRALSALQQALSIAGRYAHGFVVTPAGMRTYDVLNEVQAKQAWLHANKFDWVYVPNPESAYEPLCVNVPCGKANDFLIKLWEFLEAEVPVRGPL